MEHINYEYRDLELTPEIAAVLIPKLFGGKLYSFKLIQDGLLQYHKENGGLAPRQKIRAVTNKALGKLKEKKTATRIAYGQWRLAEHLKIEEKIIVVVNTPVVTKKLSPDPDLIVGEGKSGVYVYYFPKDRENAELKGEKIWACKIGHTEGEANERILSQQGTSNNEIYLFPLLIRTDSPRELETALHGILKSRGRWIKDAPGKEWFRTSPQEIKEIFEFI